MRVAMKARRRDLTLQLELHVVVIQVLGTEFWFSE